MRDKINQIAALFFIYLLIISPLSLALNELPQDGYLPQNQESQYENTFNNDPTPESFNNLPNPTALDLEKLIANGYTPTVGNFNSLSIDQQGTFLSKENNYRQEFAEQYYSNSANWGTNAQADAVFFKQETGLRDFLQKGAAEKNAAQQYFIKTFSAPYKFDQVADDFFFDQEKGMLKNGLTNLILVEFKDDQSIIGITSTTGGFEISRKIEEKEQKVSVAGAEAKTVSYDKEKGSFMFQLPNGQQQFEIPNDAQVTFTFDAGKVTVDGPASGLVNTKGNYAQFINHNGKLIISYNGDLDAEDAEVITSRLFMDGRYSKRGTKIQAWDVGIGGKQTVVVDKNACPEAGACIGVSTQGQWDARYLADKDKSKASTLKINLDEVSSASSFYVDPSKPQPTEEKKAEQLREQARQLRKPAQPPLPGNNAEVWINKDEVSKAITVTSKGVVAVGLYDARGNSAKPLKDEFSYKGLNGLSELDMQFSARTQTNVRGQAEFKNDQFREGIATNQDGAVFKVTHDNFRPDQADILRVECFDCTAGEAIVVQKSVAVAKETVVQGVFAGTDRAGVRLSVNVDEKGQIIFTPDKQNLGFLASQIPQDGQEVTIGNNLFVSVPCGELECNFKLSRDPRTAELGAAYEFVDPKNPETVVKRIEYPLTVGKVLGSEAVLVSEQNAAEVSRLAALIEEGKFNELPTLSFEKDDPGYAALKKKFLVESGLNFDAVSDQKYARELQAVIETTTKARETYKKYGIELDALGNFKTREDAEKYQKIVNKGLGADVDELTRAKWDLARMRVKEVESLLAACQGTSYCSVSEKDLKAATEEESRILRIRTSNYNRWKALVVKAELEKLKREAEERAKRVDKGIDATDKKELEDTKRKIDDGEKRKVNLKHTLEAQGGKVKNYRSEIRAKLQKEWLAGGGAGAIRLAIDWERFETDQNYVISLVNKHAPRDFFTNELDPEVYDLQESFRANAEAATQTQQKIGQLDTDLKAFESQNQALIEKYRLEGKDDVAAEVALLAGRYQEVNTILGGPNLATQEGIKEVIKLGKDKDGNVVVLETIDVSVLAGQSVVSDEVAKDIAGRAVRQQRDETLDQVALLYDYGYGNEAGARLQEIEADNPELAQKLEGAEQIPEALLDPDLVKLKKARLAQTDYAKRVVEQREKELEQANHQARLKKEEENLGAGREVARAWEGLNFDVTSTAGALGTVSGAGRLVEASFGFFFDSSEKAAADAFGITKIREDLDKQAFEEQQRQVQQLHSLRFKLRDYEKKELSASQAFADARAGIVRDADGMIISSSAENQISVSDEPAAALLEFDLTRSVFSEADKKLMETMNILDRSAFINQRQQEYQAERQELEFSVIARDAENAQRFNRNKLAGEAAAKYQEAVAVCPTCAGAKNVQRNLDTLNQNVLGDIIGVYTGEEAGRAVAGGLERVGVTYTRETEETFRDMAIASTDALIALDIAEVVVGAPLAAIDTLQKLRKASKAIDAAGTAVDAYRYASKGSREVFAAAKAAERAAETAEVAAEARKAVDAAKAALDAEIKAGQQASKYQQFKRAVNTPFGKFDRDVAKARNIEIDNIAAQTQNLNQAQRELAAARASGDTLAEGQSLVKISEAQEAISRSTNNIDELDDLLRVSNLAGPNRGPVRKAWDATFGKVFGAGPGEEILSAEEDFRRAADNFAEASVNARLVGDTSEAILSRARLNAAKESLEVAAEKLDDAYLNRKVERSRSAIKQRLQQAQASGSGDEIYDAVGVEGIYKLDILVSNPTVRVELEGTGLQFEIPEESPPQLRIEVEEGNNLLLRIDTSEARAEAEVEEQLLVVLADSEYTAANDIKARRLEAVGEARPESVISDIVEPCNLRAAAIFGLAACPGAAEVVEEVEEIAPRVPERAPEIPEERLPELEDRVHLDAENAPTPFQRQILEGKELERLLEEAPLSDELYRRTTKDSHGTLKLPVFENNLPPKYTLYEISMDRSTVKGLNDVSYELGTNAISTQHRELISFAEQSGLPVTTLQKTTYIAVPEGSITGIDDVLSAVENARVATSQVTKQSIKLRVGIADNADTLMETRLRTKRSLEFSEQNKVLPTKYGDDVKGWYDQLPVEQKATVNDIFVGYDETLKEEFAVLDALREQGLMEEYRQKLAQLALADLQDAKFSNLPIVKKYQSDSITGIKDGDVVVSTDGISVGQLNKDDVLLLTEQNLPDVQLAAQLGKSIDTSINKVNEVIKETYFRAVDNVNVQPAEVIAKYDEIAAAAKYPGGSITDTNELKDFLKWEFEHRGRFRGGDETFMTLRKEVLESSPDFARTLGEAVRVCETCYEVRVGFKEVGAGEIYAQAIGAADQAVIASKKLGDVPVVVDKFGNTIPLGEPGLRTGVSDVVDACAIVGGAVYGLAPCTRIVAETLPAKLEPAPEKITLEEIAEQAPSRVSSQTQEIFNREAVQLAEKKPEELQGVFYKIYNRKTTPSVIEEGEVSHFQTAFELQKKIASEGVDVNPGLIQGGWIGLSSAEELPRGNIARYYFNSKNLDSSLVVVEKVAKELSDQGIPFKIKAHPDKEKFARRTDNTVLYVDAAHREQVERIIAQLNPALFDEEVPLFTQKVSKGISWAEEPGNLIYRGRTPQDVERLRKYGISAPSFGQKRSGALAEVYTATGGKVGPEFDEVTREIFKKHGIDPDQPWLNLDSPLKELPAPRVSGVRVVEPVPPAEAPISVEVLEQQATSSVKYLGNGVFEYNDKKYVYDVGTGKWKQQRTLLWDKKVTDEDIILTLDEEWSRRLEEGALDVSDSARACAVVGGAIYGAACRVPEIEEVPEPRISGVRVIPEKEEIYFPGREPAVEQNLGKFKEGPEGFVDNRLAGQRAFDSLENGEVLRIINLEEGIDEIGLVTIEGNKRYLTTIDTRTGVTAKTELVPTILSQTSLEQTAVETLVVEDFVATGGASIKRTGTKVDPSKVENNLLDVVRRGETVPLGSTFAVRKEDNVFTLGSEEYLYSADGGWTTKGFLGFGKKQVTNPQDLAHLEAARLNVPLTEFGAPRQRFYFSEYVAPEWETGRITVLEVYRHDGGILVRSEANFYIIDEAGDIYSVRERFGGSALSSVPEGVDKDLIIGTLNTNPKLKENFLSEVSKLEPKVVDDATKGRLYLQEIANDKDVTILAAGPDFDNIGVNVHGSHHKFVDSYNALSSLGPEVQGIEANPILRELHQRFKKKGVEPPRLTHDQVRVMQKPILGSYEDGRGIRYQIFTDEKSVLDQARAAHGYKGNDIEEAKRLLAQEQLKLLAGHETTHHAFANLLDQAQRDTWVNYVRTTNDPGMRKAWDYLKSTPNYAHLDDVRLADEMLAFRYDYHLFGDATSNFKFLPSQQELDILERLGLPTRRDVAVKKSDTLFELAGQEYVYDAGKQIWTTKGTGIGPLRFGKQQVTDPEIISRLDTARLNVPIEEARVRPAGIAEVPKPEILNSNKRVLGPAAADPRVEEALEKLPISINCKSTFVGSAISSCSAIVEVEKIEHLREVDRINSVLEETGNVPIEVVITGDNVVDLEKYRENAQFIKETKNELDALLSQIITPTVRRNQIELQIDNLRSLEEIIKDTFGEADYRYRDVRFNRIALDSKYNDPLINPFTEVVADDKTVAQSFLPNHKVGNVEGLVGIIESEALIGPASRGEKVSSLLAKRGQADSIFLSAGGPYSHLFIGEVPDRHNLPLLVFERNTIYDHPTFKATPRDSIGYADVEEIASHSLNPEEANRYLELLAANNKIEAEVTDFAVGSDVSKPVGTFAPEITIEGRIELDSVKKIILTEEDKNQLLRQLREGSKFRSIKSNTEMEKVLKERFEIELTVPDEGLNVDQMYWKEIGQPISTYE